MTFSVNITNSPPIDSFQIALSYNFAAMTVSSTGISYAGGVLGPTPNKTRECVNGISLIGTFCPPREGAGTVDLALQLQGGTTPNPTNGLLYSITAKITGQNVSQIHLITVELFNAGVEVPSQGSDGYFTNIKCGSAFCQPPVPVLSVTPKVPLQGAPARFDGSASYSLNLDAVGTRATIVQWFWSWGEADLGSPDTTFMGVVNQTFNNANNYTVTMGVKDSAGIIGFVSIRLLVNRIVIDVGVYDLSATPTFQVSPGTPVTIKAAPENLGTVAAHVTLRILIEGRQVRSSNYTLPRHCAAGCANATYISYPWPTGNLPVKAYMIQARVDNVTGDTNPDNDQQTLYVQLWPPQGGSLVSLSLFSTIGVSILALIVIGVAVAIFRPKPKEEPL